MIKCHVNLDKLYSFDFLGLDNDDFENYSASASRLISDKARTATVLNSTFLTKYIKHHTFSKVYKMLA